GKTSGQEAAEAQVEEELSQLITRLTNEINWYLHERNLTRADLAGRMGVSPGRVSQVLSGGENLTLRTLASLATALDARFELDLRPREAAAGAANHDARPAAPPAVAADQPPPRPHRWRAASPLPRGRWGSARGAAPASARRPGQRQQRHRGSRGRPPGQYKRPSRRSRGGR